MRSLPRGSLSLVVSVVLLTSACDTEVDDDSPARAPEPAPTQIASTEDRALIIPGFPQVGEAPTGPETSAVRDTLARYDLGDNQWRTGNGFSDCKFVSGVWACVQPQKGSYKDSLVHGKVLMRYQSRGNINYLGIKTGFNYLIAALSGGSWYAVIVPANSAEPIKRVPMQFEEHSGIEYGSPRAKWSEFGNMSMTTLQATESWATCDPDGCCCTGTRACNDAMRIE